MLLKIILVIVFVKILVEFLWVKEGLLDLDPPILNRVNDTTPKSENCNINIKFPNYDSVTNTYNNNNNYIFNNFSNIKKAANPDAC